MELKGNIAIYGAGGIGKELFDVLSKMGHKIICFIDKNKTGTKIENINIVSLDQAKKYDIDTIIIGIFSYPKECNIYDIVSLLKKYNFNNIITFEEMFQNYYKYFSKSNYYWLAPPMFFEKDIERINKAREVFYDEKSKMIFDSQIKHRLGASYEVLEKPDYNNIQYFPEDVPLQKDNINFIDLGAYIGDTLINILDNGIKLNKVLAFEPNIKNYKELSINMKNLQKKYDIEEIFLLPIGVSDTIELASFNYAISDGSFFSDNGEVNVPIVSIDDIIYGFNPNYIKMDIEGLEFKALNGLKNTIIKYRPNLAISLYHLPTDLYDIPLWFNENFDNYFLYLRVHFSHCFETVLYAAEQSRAEQSRAEQSRAEQSRAEQSRDNI